MVYFEVNFEHQIGGVCVNLGDGDVEYDYIIEAEQDYERGEIEYRLMSLDGDVLYSRVMRRVHEYKLQALHDIEEKAKDLHPDDEIFVHLMED